MSCGLDLCEGKACVNEAAEGCGSSEVARDGRCFQAVSQYA